MMENKYFKARGFSKITSLKVLRYYRENGLTLQEIGEIVGLDKSTISKIRDENKENIFSTDQLHLFAEHEKRSLGDFLNMITKEEHIQEKYKDLYRAAQKLFNKPDNADAEQDCQVVEDIEEEHEEHKGSDEVEEERSPEEAVLALGTQHGDVMDKEVFVERCRTIANLYDGLMRQAYNFLRGRQKAEDVVQEACELFLLSKREITNPAAWFYTTVKHLAYDLKKNDSKTISLESMLGFRSKLLDPSDNLLDKETKEWVRRAVSELPDIYRSVVMLYYFDGKSAKEAAKLQGISIATFLSRLHRARKYLYALLAGLGEDTLK